MIYLDHQASTPIRPEVLRAMMPHLTEHFGNPHSDDHAAGWAASAAIEEAREAVAARINADSDEIIFTSGATEANNLAILGLTEEARNKGNIVVSAIEHKAVLGPARELARRGLDLRVAPVSPSGVVDLNTMSTLIDSETLLVSLMLVNNEVGTVQPVSEVATLCSKTGALLHVDAAQGLSWMSINVDELGADLLSLSGHKAGGPKGIGALYVRRDVKERLRPIVHGGEQEGGLRPGTLPTALCAGLGAACLLQPDASKLADWRKITHQLEDHLLRMVSGAYVNGAASPRHPGCISVTFPEIEADALIARLQPHIALSRGSACTSGMPEPSHVLRAMQLSAAESASTIRLGTGLATTVAEVLEASHLIAHALAGLSGSRAAA